MLKAVLQPVYFKSGMDKDYKKQLDVLKNILRDFSKILEPVPLKDENIDKEADAVLFPQLIGDAYQELAEIKNIKLPLLIITSEFGTVKMWDYEIVHILKTEGCNVFAPYNIKLTKNICKMLALKKEMKKTAFVVYQDNPGQGFQADIFKRFFWWEDTCINGIKDKFGINIIKNSYKKFSEKAREIPDEEALNEWKKWDLPVKGVNEEQIANAVKIYLQLKKEIPSIEASSNRKIGAMGINCLNESHFSNTTPCLAWAMLYESSGILWGCEADLMSMLTKYLINKSIDVPVMMSNLYPFLVGKTAIKHEKIDEFPSVSEPENHILVAHCGYLGVLPLRFAEKWMLKHKVLEIVNNNAIAIDARLPIGDITIAKLGPSMNSLFIAEGILENYVQYPGSDCRNGAVIRVKNGYKMMDNLYSHHAIFIPGHIAVELRLLAQALELEITEI